MWYNIIGDVGVKKNNNEGWGFVPFLLLLLLLVSALFFTSFLINDFEKRLEEEKENHANLRELENYKRYESIIADETIKHYTDDEIVPIKLLPISNAIKEECTGYAKKSGTIYKAFISCGKYTTVGYNSDYLK